MEETNFQFVMLALRDLQSEMRRLQSGYQESAHRLETSFAESVQAMNQSFAESVQAMNQSFAESVGAMSQAFRTSTDNMLEAVGKVIQGMELLRHDQDSLRATVKQQAERLDAFDKRLSRLEQPPPKSQMSTT